MRQHVGPGRGLRRGDLLRQGMAQPRTTVVQPRRARLGLASAETSTATVVTTSPAAEDGPSTSAPAAQPPLQPLPAAPRTVRQLRMRSAAAYLPHPDKESYGGEDAHFVSNLSGGAIGVADGVGGWAESGINPAEYSRTLMRVACAYVEGLDTRAVASVSMDESSPCASLSSVDSLSLSALSSIDGSAGGAAAATVDPRAALDTAHKLTRVPGSATACVVQLCPEKRSLIAANLGDSGFIVVRQGQIALRSSPKQHFFDCPLQFGAFPEHVDGTDTADDAELYHLPVEIGDVVIAGSDGLWDNVYSKELLELVPRSPGEVDSAADRIARLARRHASDPEFASPYTSEAKAQGLDWPWWMKVMNTRFRDGKVQLGELTGGKMDDITVLVAVVEEVDVPLPAEQPCAQAALQQLANAQQAAAAAEVASGNGKGAAAAAAAGEA